MTTTSIQELTEHVSQLYVDPSSPFNSGIQPFEDEEINEYVLPERPVEDVDAEIETFSIYSTPSAPGHRNGTTFATAKKWLFSWLKTNDFFRCSITLTPIAKNRVVQVAHIMLPQSAKPEAVRLTGLILGMHQAEMSIHSRIFLMPLRVDVHYMVDMLRIFMIPSQADLRSLENYLISLPKLEKEKEAKLEKEKKAKLEKEKEAKLEKKKEANSDEEKEVNDKQSLWSALRKGSLSGFEHLQDGRTHEYKLLRSPHFDDLYPLTSGNHLFLPPYLNFPPIVSHVSPFAIALHALKVLESPHSGMLFESDKVYAPRDPKDLGNIQDMVERALLGLAMRDNKPMVPQEVQEHAAAFVAFVKFMDQRVPLFQTSSSQRIGSRASTRSSTRSLRSGSIPPSFSSPPSATLPMPSTPTPSTRMIGAGTGQVKGKRRQASSSSPTPASQIKQNYLVAHPPPRVFGLLHVQPTRLLRHFLHRDRIATSG